MVSETENADILDEATDIIVEPATDAMLKLATFTNHATKHLVCPCHTEWKNEKKPKVFEKCKKFAMGAKKFSVSLSYWFNLLLKSLWYF